MSLYPTLEDLKVDELSTAQTKVMAGAVAPSAPVPFMSGVTYGDLAGYMGLDTSAFHYNDMGELVPGPPIPSVVCGPPTSTTSSTVAVRPAAGPVVIPTSTPTDIKHGVRRVVICKDQHGKVGLQIRDIDKGIFISFVRKGSPAALGGLRFGDQLLDFNGTTLAGMSGNKVMELISKAPPNNLAFIVRDRPFERTITMYKDSHGTLGMMICDGECTAIVKDSSAARNGMLVHHQLVEANGQNVLGMKDKQLMRLLEACPRSVTVTIMPSFVYQHMIKKLGKSQLRDEMDRSLPDA